MIMIKSLFLFPLFALAMDTSSEVTRFTFATVKVADLKNNSDFLMKNKKFLRLLPQMIKDGKRQIKLIEEQKTPCADIAKATAVSLVGTGVGLTFAWATGYIIPGFLLTTLPTSFVIGHLTYKEGNDRESEDKNKLTLLRNISTRLKERKQANKEKERWRATLHEEEDFDEQYEKREQARRFKKLAKLNQEKQAREYEERMQEEQQKQITVAPDTIQKVQQQAYAATNSSVGYYAQSSRQAEPHAASNKYLPQEKHFNYNGKSYLIKITPQGTSVYVCEYVYDYYDEDWVYNANAYLSYDEAFAKYGEKR